MKTLFYSYRYLLILAVGLTRILLSRAEPNSQFPSSIAAPQKGFLAPDFSLPDATGSMIALSDLRGKPVLLNIWASWCTPCRAEMPAMQQAYQAFQSQDFVILAVNATNQDKTTAALDFAKEMGLTFPILFDQSGSVSSLYKVQALPTSFFIDKNRFRA